MSWDSGMNRTRGANRKPAFDSAREAQCEALAPTARSPQICGARCNALQHARNCSACWQPPDCNGCYYDCRASSSYAYDSAALLVHAFPEADAATLLERLSSRRLVFFGDSVTMQMVISATCVLHRLAIAQDSEARHVPIRFTGGPYTPTPDGAKMHNLSCGTLDLRRQLPDRRLSNQSRRLRLSLCYVTWPVVHWDTKVQSTAFSASLKTSFERMSCSATSYRGATSLLLTQVCTCHGTKSCANRCSRSCDRMPIDRRPRCEEAARYLA